MFSKNKNEFKADNPYAKKHFKKAVSYEEDRNYLLNKSNKLAWLVASIFGFFSVISWVGLYLLLPLKEVTPYVIRVDQSTGIPDVVTAINEETLSSDEALDRYFVNQYIQLREGYTYQTIQKTYELTQLLSSPQVATAFREEYARPDSLDNSLGMGTANVKVVSITLEKINANNLATVRYNVEYTDNKNTKIMKNYISRIAYKYNPQQKLTLSYRIENPVGFQVTSYQRNEENL